MKSTIDIEAGRVLQVIVDTMSVDFVRAQAYAVNMVRMHPKKIDPKVKANLIQQIGYTKDYKELRQKLWDLRLYYQGEGLVSMGTPFRRKKTVCSTCGRAVEECVCWTTPTGRRWA